MTSGGPDNPAISGTGSGDFGPGAQDPSAGHVPVLLAEVLAALAPEDGEVVIDGTFGAGGYTRAILEAANTSVIGIDRDPGAIKNGAGLSQVFRDRLRLAEGVFADMQAIASAQGHGFVDGIVLDIGVSSMQIDEAARGFSFAKDGPLDMRMGANGATAADVVNTMDEVDLANVIFRLGEERRSRAVARAIVKRRAVEPFSRTGDLADIVRRAVGGKKGRIHPATRTFQGLRIFVNGELEQLAHGLGAAERLLKPSGRLVVVTFHSLEDRIVKRFFHARCGLSARASRHRPLTDAGPDASFTTSVRGVVKPGAQEVAVNPRARSARLRWATRNDNPAWALDPGAIGMPAVKTAFTG